MAAGLYSDVTTYYRSSSKIILPCVFSLISRQHRTVRHITAESDTVHDCIALKETAWHALHCSSAATILVDARFLVLFDVDYHSRRLPQRQLYETQATQ